MMAQIIHIVAMTTEGIIGIENKLPFYLKEDLLNFKSLTNDNLIVMGYNTFLSIYQHYKTSNTFLPNRKITVICSDRNKAAERQEQYEPLSNVLFLDIESFNILQASNLKPILIVGGTKLFSKYPPTVIIATEVNLEVQHKDSLFYYPYFKELKSINWLKISYPFQVSESLLTFKNSIYIKNY